MGDAALQDRQKGSEINQNLFDGFGGPWQRRLALPAEEDCVSVVLSGREAGFWDT